MKEIVVISGKGGTGKTSLTASFAVLGGKDLIVADCDVDAADMHLLLDPDFNNEQDFYSGGVLAVIDANRCTACGRCATICRFDAISLAKNNEYYEVDSIGCEGCGYCARICPANAIKMIEEPVGKWYISNIKTGSKMVHAKLGAGAENSGKLVAKVKEDAKKIATDNNINIVLVDGSPGVGCPVVSSLSGASYVVFVTEPTVSGIHDLKRVNELVKKFNIRAGCIINKVGLNPDIEKQLGLFLEKENIDFLADIPYNEDFTKAMVEGKTIVEYSDTLKEIVNNIWEKIKKIS